MIHYQWNSRGLCITTQYESHTCTWESFVNTRNSIHKSTQFLLERPKHLLVYPGFCLGVGIVSWFFGGCLAMAYQAVRGGAGRVLNITSKVSHQLRSTHTACLKGTTWQFMYKHCKNWKRCYVYYENSPVLSCLSLSLKRTGCCFNTSTFIIPTPSKTATSWYLRAGSISRAICPKGQEWQDACSAKCPLTRSWTETNPRKSRLGQRRFTECSFPNRWLRRSKNVNRH